MGLVSLEIVVDGQVAFVSPTLSVKDMGLSHAEQQAVIANMWRTAISSPLFPSKGFLLRYAALPPRNLVLNGKVQISCGGISVSVGDLKLVRVRPDGADWKIDHNQAKSLIENFNNPPVAEPSPARK